MTALATIGTFYDVPDLGSTGGISTSLWDLVSDYERQNLRLDRLCEALSIDVRCEWFPSLESRHSALLIPKETGGFDLVVRVRASEEATNEKLFETGRGRFLVAHEVAHSLFYDLSSAPPKRTTSPGPAEELFCDALAGSLCHLPADEALGLQIWKDASAQVVECVADANLAVTDDPQASAPSFAPVEEPVFSRTTHVVREGDARDMSWMDDESVHLVVTSPPYGSLKEYPEHSGQLGNLASYEEFLGELDKVWAECLRVLVPGGRVACVVGDICISRRQGGRHYVLPLSADIQVRGRQLGFDVLTPIRWLKVSNINLEASRSSRFLGKPNLPNGIVKNDLEHILFLRKPGGYRSPSTDQEQRSYISTDDYVKLFSPVWSDVAGQLRRDHPAPYPVEIPKRLIRMFSFTDDTVLDPFAGTGSTAVAAIQTARNSISVDVEPRYVDALRSRLDTYGLGVTVEGDGYSSSEQALLAPAV